jgi:hypothetical protein
MFPYDHRTHAVSSTDGFNYKHSPYVCVDETIINYNILSRVINFYFTVLSGVARSPHRIEIGRRVCVRV